MTVALVSGTNGKTTTTTLLALGLAASVTTATNRPGANLASGLTGALLASPDATFAALEVDEAVLPWALRELRPGGGGPVEPVAGPARPAARGAGHGRTLAAGPGRGCSPAGRGQRR